MAQGNPLFESSLFGLSVRVFPDRVEYKAGFLSPVDIIPINQISSIIVGNLFHNWMTIETAGGREYAIITGKKKELANAIYRAQAVHRSPSQSQVGAVRGVADELAKLAELRAQGILSDEEFELQKQLLLGAPPDQYTDFSPGTRVLVTSQDGKRHRATVVRSGGGRSLCTMPDGKNYWIPARAICTT